MEKKDKKKKGGLVLLGISLLLSLFMKDNVLALELTNINPNNYTYTNNNKVYPFYLAVNNESNRPLFQERGNVGFIDTSTYTYHNESYGLEPYEFNALYLTTNGKEATAENLDKRLAMQLYLFEDFASRNKDNISFSFDTEYYHKISEELLKQGKEMIKEEKYTYQIKQGEWTFIPKEWEGNYTISMDRFPLPFVEKEDGFDIAGANLGTYTTEIFINKYREYGTYFQSNDYRKSNYIETIKPCTIHSTLEIEIIPPIYDIHVPENQIGYNLEIVNSSLKEQKVSYNLKIDDEYFLEDFKITKKDGSEITVDNNSFTMPNEDVYINVKVDRKTHDIKIINNEGIIVNCVDKAKVKDLVNLDVKVLDGYELTNIYMNNQEVNLNDLNFVMPNEDVIITSKTKKKIYQIESEISNASIKVNNEASFGEKINFEIKEDEGYTIDEIKVLDANNNEIKIEENSFIMPNSDVKIIVTTKKKIYQIESEISNASIKVNNEASFGEKINFEIEEDEGYTIDEVKVLDANNNEIKIEENSFIMPNSDVKIIVTTKKKIYQIESEISNASIKVNNEASFGEKINFEIEEDEGYTIDEVKVLDANNNEIKIEENSFIMPNSDVKIIVTTKKKIYQIESEISNASIKVNNEASFGEKINFEIEEDEGYLIDEIKVLDANQNEIKIEENSFIMPNSDVKIIVTTKKEMYLIINDNDHIKMKNKAYFGEKIVFELDKGYVIDQIKILDKNGNIVNVKDNSFIMPNSVVKVNVLIRKESYLIIDDNEGVFIDVNSEASFGERVDFEVFEDEGYLIDEIKVFDANNNEIKIDENSFIMPDCDVKIIVTTNKEKHQIFYDIDDDLKFLMDDYYEYNASVLVNYETLNDCELKYVSIKSKSGIPIEIDDDWYFTMPNEDIIIKARSYLPIKQDDQLFKICFLDENNHELQKPIYAKLDDLVEVPFFDNYEDIEIINKDGSVGFLLSSTYCVEDGDVNLIYKNYINEDDEDYYYENIPNTYENFYEPFLGLFIMSCYLYCKKYLLA